MSNIIMATEKMVKDYMKSFDPSHDMFHIERVRKLALELAHDSVSHGKKVDMEIVELAALCHDVGDPKYYQGVITGGDIVSSFLTQKGYDSFKAELVSRIVNNVGFRKELGWNDKIDDPCFVQWRNNCIELHVVQDADKLDAMGAFGILRCGAYSGKINVPLYDPYSDPIRFMTKDQYEEQTVAKNGSAINHFHEKLLKLSSMLRTPKGKELGKQRHDFMQLFIEQVTKEYNMES
ncbi:uncharacterized protein BX664DRAFT_337979 [Halteromyces radiatus]|uniref:uncharacterized protein n=1 Tax=Halteromyces radiatus TaxID=101107 RepID=UPI00221E6B53|nr:uncharacterized protein BX664DRAFT_337979 [Halteromyces radiatus]KAI8084867.1 hypothetical protein BX664DRAFT_337979 [Halteromyces radiatus]